MKNWVWLWVISFGVIAVWSGCEDPRREEVSADTLSFEARLAFEEDTINQFIQEQGYDSVFVTSNGLRIVPILEGNGNATLPGDIISVFYIGSFLNGRVFDTNSEDAALDAGIFVEGNDYLPLTRNLGDDSLIEGWNEGLSYMDEKSKAILIMPSHLAYGAAGFGSTFDSDDNIVQVVGPFRVLKFEVSLVKIRR